MVSDRIACHFQSMKVDRIKMPLCMEHFFKAVLFGVGKRR